MMDFGFAFIPEKLIQANIEIQSMHPREREFRAAEHVDDTRELLNRLEKAPEDMLEASAQILTDQEVDMLAGYLPYNYFERDTWKFYELLKPRISQRSAQILFREWQENFGNPECNNFLKALALDKPSFQEFLGTIHIKPEDFLKVLDSRYIPLGFDEVLLEGKFENGDEFNEKLLHFGVIPDSFLDIECRRALLTLCGRAEYLRCSQENVLEIIKSYDWHMLRKFTTNFLEKMSLSELQAYPAVAEYLRSVVGHRRSDTFQAFFEQADPQILQQYIDWINLYKINTYFENDDRSRFWKQYRYLNVIRYPFCNTVILEFEYYVCVEFLGPERGTIYICEKEVFRKKFYPHLETMSNADLRSFFRVHKDKCMEYRNHSGRWQSHVGNLISKKEMAEKIRI